MRCLQRTAVSCLLLLFAFCFTVIQAPPADAVIIGTSNFEYSGPIYSTSSGPLVNPDNSYRVSPVFGGARPFGWILFSTSAVGSAYEADSTSPAFTSAVAVLTDGNDDWIGYYSDALYGNDVRWRESAKLSGPGFNGIDFAGQTIDKMILALNSFSCNVTGYDPLTHHAGTTSFCYTITYEADSAPVPEPFIAGLLGIGLIGFAGLYRLQSRRSS